jgi:hypothetical protein
MPFVVLGHVRAAPLDAQDQARAESALDGDPLADEPTPVGDGEPVTDPQHDVGRLGAGRREMSDDGS